MPSFTRSRCLQRQTHVVNDLEIQAQDTNHSNSSESSELSTVATIESPTDNAEDATFTSAKQSRSYLEICLNFYYFTGVSPFRVDYKRNLRSSWINKLTSLLIIVLAMTYTIFNIRRLAWDLEEGQDQGHNETGCVDENSKKLSQQEKASTYIGLVHQFCLMVLYASVFRLTWCKRIDFLKLFNFLENSKISSTLKSSLGRFLIIPLSTSSTMFIALLCTIGGLNLRSDENWSFFNILLHHEGVFLLGLKKSYEIDVDPNHSMQINATNVDDDSSGIFMSDGDLETIIFGSVGMTMNLCQNLLSLFSYDCLLLSAISLWISTEPLREQVERWENRRGKSDSNNEIEIRKRAVELVITYKDIARLSMQINAITNSILPALVFMNIITMSYFMHSCVIRNWYFAFFLTLGLSKVCVAISFALKTSSMAEKYYSWFISEDVQVFLDLTCNQLQRTVAEMKEIPLGIGCGVFYIDIRFVLSALGIVSTYFYMVTGAGI